jgi:phenylpyruvate tautomerase PptA (4-oxalocrotonate tautomerase family)
MPFVQISLIEGHSPEHISAISESVHQALVEEFKIPEPDKFQVIHEVKPHQLLFPDSFLGISHTENLVYIHISAKEGRTADIKRRLYARIVSLIQERSDLSADDVIIVLADAKAENWSFGQGRAQLVDKA